MKEKIISMLSKELDINEDKIENLLEVPPVLEMGDYAFPCFALAKIKKKNPMLIAKELAENLKKKLVKGVVGIDVKAGYVNFFVDKKMLAEKVLKNAGKINLKQGKKYVMDYSHPNVAKHFAIHNLRSTLIGHALYNILKASGNNIYSINHLGDWGTQYGKLIVGYKKWGKNIKSVEDLNKLYIKFHNKAEKNSELDDEARKEFKKLEQGDKENEKLWKKFYDISLKEFNKVYDILGIKFDEVKGESGFRDLSKIKKKLESNNLLKKSEGAMVVETSGDRPPLIFQKSDEASTYASRDLAAILERIEKHKPDKILYVVDVAQSLHFEQVFEVSEKIGIKDRLEHIKFGRLKFKDKGMSTRKGNVILFEELLEKAEKKAEKMILNKNPDLKGKKKAMRKTALAGIIFNDLKQNRKLDVVFDWDVALQSEGRTGPYLLYSYARANSILKKVKSSKKMKIVDLKKQEIELIKKIDSFEDALDKASSNFEPSVLAEYCYELASLFNEFYHACPVINDEQEGFRLKLVKAYSVVLKKGLNLLGIDVLDEM